MQDPNLEKEVCNRAEQDFFHFVGMTSFSRQEENGSCFGDYCYRSNQYFGK